MVIPVEGHSADPVSEEAAVNEATAVACRAVVSEKSRNTAVAVVAVDSICVLDLAGVSRPFGWRLSETATVEKV